MCFDIFSPPSGASDVISHVDRQGWTRLFEQLFRVDKWSVCRG